MYLRNIVSGNKSTMSCFIDRIFSRVKYTPRFNGRAYFTILFSYKLYYQQNDQTFYSLLMVCLIKLKKSNETNRNVLHNLLFSVTIERVMLF